MLKVLIVDDTIFYRKIISDILAQVPGVKVVGSANNGKIALSRIKTLKPDLVTLDVEMPEMNGLELLQEVMSQGLAVDFIMVSSLTERGGQITIQALQLGAFDFITKPDESNMERSLQHLKRDLLPKIKAYQKRKDYKLALRGKAKEQRPAVSRKVDLKEQLARTKRVIKRSERSQAVAIGVSTGGPNALNRVLPKLPAKIGVPVFLVQHMPPVFTASLAKALDSKCQLKVKEAMDGEKVEPNMVYVAPGGKQMKVASGASPQVKVIRITNDPPENNCRPSVDYLFRSVAREYGSKATGVIMTGMGADGRLGLQVMKASGAVGIAQDEASCVVYGMPKAVVEAGLADIVAPLDQLAAEILKTVQ